MPDTCQTTKDKNPWSEDPKLAVKSVPSIVGVLLYLGVIVNNALILESPITGVYTDDGRLLE
jgi:hypothetical protein